MTSREAFEAWLGIKPCGAAHDLSWKAWQAAIQHARDVALQQCSLVGMRADQIGRNYHEGRLDGAAQCAAAIKEALK